MLSNKIVILIKLENSTPYFHTDSDKGLVSLFHFLFSVLLLIYLVSLLFHQVLFFF